VHLWTTTVAGDEATVVEALRILSPSERGRAGALPAGAVRRRFVLCRAFLRSVLADYLGRAPEAVVLFESGHGKPVLIPEPGDADLRFCVSQAVERVACVVGADRAVGVDLERVRPVADLPRLARTVLNQEEWETWCALPAGDVLPAFFRAWTRKEAVLKADAAGRGGWGELMVTLRPSEPARVLRWPGWLAGGGGWALAEPELGPGWALAVAGEGALPLRVEEREFAA
jgi:4'-phosphopantetheinyl transferase